MVPLDEAEGVLAQWNEVRPNDYVPWERVRECIIAFTDWQEAIARERPPGHTTGHLIRHQSFARWIPDELLLLLTDEEDLCADCDN